MLRWLAVMCLAYGMLSLSLQYRQPRLPGVWEQGLDFPPLLPPRGHDANGALALPDKRPPNRLDFETEGITAVLRPGTDDKASIVKLEEGAQVLRWQLDLRRIPANALGLPLAEPRHGATRLQLMARTVATKPTADPAGIRTFYVGLREADGSVYYAERNIDQHWTQLAVPLEELHSAPRYPDENNKLDSRQIAGFLAVCLRAPDDLISPGVIELDDIELK